MSSPARFEVWGVPGIPEVHPGDDLVQLLIDAMSDDAGPAATGDAAADTATDPAATDATDAATPPLANGDIVVVTSKIISKAEGRIRTGTDRDDAIDSETVRTISEWTTPRGRTRIVETRHGFVMAAAGVDASNVNPGDVVLLPEDPDASARRLRDGLRERLGVHVGVVLTDTAGRVWRNGVVDMAIGAAGVHVVDDLRGKSDPYGNDLGVTVVAVADELAAASELVRAKLSGVPVAVIRGLPHLIRPADNDARPDPGASVLVRPSAEDRFRLGTPEAMRAAVFARRTVRSFTAEPVDPAVVRRAVEAALSAPQPMNDGPAARFVVAESESARTALTDALRTALWDDDADADAADVATLSAAGCVVVPCLVGGSMDDLLALGASVENLLVALAADGLGASWLFPTQALTVAATTALDPPDDWTPIGAVALGHPADPGPEHPARSLDHYSVII